MTCTLCESQGEQRTKGLQMQLSHQDHPRMVSYKYCSLKVYGAHIACHPQEAFTAGLMPSCAPFVAMALREQNSNEALNATQP
eukprot:384688-Pelagomonas_calceolata.AAC.8